MTKVNCAVCGQELCNPRCQRNEKGSWRIECENCTVYYLGWELFKQLKERPLHLRDSRVLSLFLRESKEPVEITHKNLTELIKKADTFVTKELFVETH